MSAAIAALAGEFTAMRRSLGYRSPSQERAVRSLARYLDQAGIGAPVPLQASLDWAASTTSADPRNPARRLAVVRVFLRHLAALDGATGVPPPGLLGPTLRRTPPHVYSGDEIAGLLDAAAGLAPAGGLRPHAYTTLFALIACTGMRISETLMLACADVDLEQGVITVRAGKRGRTRIIPLHPTALAPLRGYAAGRARRFGPPGGSEAFFRTDASDKISYGAASCTFTSLRVQLGWTAEGRARVPRVHDLRHSMVVRRIQAWHAEGADVDAKIAVLATYLGHQEMRDVYWYLSSVPELMSIIACRFEDFAAADPAGAS
jgi:integrase